ncbi:MAG: neutral zinc metallopeptidase [Thermoanaerobaculia bacterium]
MRWRDRSGSSNVEDRRGRAPMGLPMGRGGLGCGGLILVLAIAYFLGVDPQALLQVVGESSSVEQPLPGSTPTGAPQDELGRFASVVLADTEETWSGLFARMGGSYREPTLVLFTQAVRSGCGFASAATGPFYCPADGKVYLDLGFFQELDRRLGAPGDFAQAYVIAHEIGHHVQNLLGISDRVSQAQQSSSREQGNALSVRLELQADCLAGVWAYHAHHERQLLEPGDVEEGLRAAAAIGDDTLQKQAQGYTVPETWTHGSSDQRVRWLRRGLESGDPDACQTFGS